MGYQTLKAMALAETTPPAARVAAARALVELAGHGGAAAGDAVKAAHTGAVALADMTETQLIDHLAALQAALLSARRETVEGEAEEVTPAIPPDAPDIASLL